MNFEHGRMFYDEKIPFHYFFLGLQINEDTKYFWGLVILIAITLLDFIKPDSMKRYSPSYRPHIIELIII
jgi:hypothetical protein